MNEQQSLDNRAVLLEVIEIPFGKHLVSGQQICWLLTDGRLPARRDDAAGRKIEARNICLQNRNFGSGVSRDKGVSWSLRPTNGSDVRSEKDQTYPTTFRCFKSVKLKEMLSRCPPSLDYQEM